MYGACLGEVMRGRLAHMQLWLVRGSEISIREQLVTQVILGILSGDLPSGGRLPSTRELARRFRLHPNTISTGYRHLERSGWVEFRHGSGVYVRVRIPEELRQATNPTDKIIANVCRTARELGIPLSAARIRLRQWLELQPPDHFMLIEPDEELRRIVVFEMRQSLTVPVKGCGFSDRRVLGSLEGSVPVALPSKAELMRQWLPTGLELIKLQIRSVPSSLAKWLPPPSAALIGIASRWPSFLNVARTILVASGFHADALLFRNAQKRDWQRGLREAVAIVCDSLTAAEWCHGHRVIPFPILAESSIQELLCYQEFLIGPSHKPL